MALPHESRTLLEVFFVIWGAYLIAFIVTNCGRGR
jgi:bacteriorhodopsin